MEWESVVNRVAKCELGKEIVYGREARWWDEQIRTELMQDGKCMIKLLMVEKICGMSIVDYRKR